MNKNIKAVKYRNYNLIKRDQASLELIFGFAFFVLAVLNRYKICGILSFVLFTFYLIIYSLYHKRILMKYMFLLFGIVFYFVGNAICVFFKVYLVELGVTTYYNGSLSVFAFCYWIYLTLLSILDFKLAPLCYKNFNSANYKISKTLTLNGICIKYGRQIVFILSLILFIFVLQKPAFLNDYNRFEYAKRSLPGLLFKVRTIPILLAPIVVVSVLEDKKLKNIKQKIINILLIYFPYMLFALWIGNKFGIFWQLFYSIAIPFSIYTNLERIKNMSLISVC